MVEAQIGASTGLSWRWFKVGELAAISGTWWEVLGRWVLQDLLSGVLAIGTVRRCLALALFKSA